MTGKQRDRKPPASFETSYKIRVRGHLGAIMLRAFPGLRAETQGQDTLLRGAVADQAALHGVLAQIETLGLELLEVRRLQPDTMTAHVKRGSR
ncbi:MAG: hypothetical protein ACLP8X_04005 [Streptosporangiaceae bacterium]